MLLSLHNLFRTDCLLVISSSTIVFLVFLYLSLSLYKVSLQLFIQQLIPRCVFVRVMWEYSSMQVFELVTQVAQNLDFLSHFITTENEASSAYYYSFDLIFQTIQNVCQLLSNLRISRANQLLKEKKGCSNYDIKH